MKEKAAQRLALVVIAAIERRLAQPGALPPAARRIGELLDEIAADVDPTNVRQGVRRIAAQLKCPAQTGEPGLIP